jgi:cellulose synthase operon protein C
VTSPTEQGLRERLAGAAELGYGEAKDAQLEDVLREAEAAGFARLAFDTRLELLNSYGIGPQRVKLFVPFARCLADYDRDPERYDDRVLHRLLWSFKHVVTSLVYFPEVPLAQVRGALADMARRYAAHGRSPHAVHTYQCLAADHLGDTAAADEEYQRWSAAPRDELSDCRGCEPTSRAAYLSARGRDEEAIAIAEPVLSGELGCVQQPQTALTALLLPYARTGRHDEARAAHRRAYRVLRSQPEDLDVLADHVEFCALTGNESRGLELLQRHLPWLDRPVKPYAAMRFAATAALLLRRVEEAGQGGLTVPRPAHRDRPAADVAVPELRETLAAQAIELAGRFDRRNGTGHQGRLVRGTLAAEPVAEHIPLSTTARSRPPARPAQPVAEDLTGVPFAELLDRAEAQLFRQEAAASAAAFGHLESRPEAADPEPAGRILLGRSRLAGGDPAAMETALEQAIELFEKAGAEGRRQRALGQLGVLHGFTGRVADGVAAVRAELGYATAHGEDRDVLAALLRLQGVLQAPGADGDPAEIAAVLDRAVERAGRLGDPQWLGQALEERADFHEAADPDRALADITAAVGHYGEADARMLQSVALQKRSVLLAQRDELDEALAVAGESLAVLPASAPGARRALVLNWQARLLSGLGRVPEAIPLLVDAVGHAGGTGNPHVVAESRLRLAYAYADTDRPLDAADAAEDALGTFEAVGDTGSAGAARRVLAEAHEALGEPELAASRYAELVSGPAGEPGERAQLLIALAGVLDQLDRDAEAAARYAEAAGFCRDAGHPAQVAFCHYQGALSTLWAHGPDPALELLARAETVITELPDGREDRCWHQAQLDGVALRIFRAAGRTDEAVRRAENAVRLFTELAADQRIPGAQLMFGQLLIEAGRHADAEPVLRAALARYRPDTSSHRNTAHALSVALAALDRDPEAVEIRRAAGLPE